MEGNTNKGMVKEIKEKLCGINVEQESWRPRSAVTQDRDAAS